MVPKELVELSAVIELSAAGISGVGRDASSSCELPERASRNARVGDRLVCRHPGSRSADEVRKHCSGPLCNELRHRLDELVRDVETEVVHAP